MKVDIICLVVNNYIVALNTRRYTVYVPIGIVCALTCCPHVHNRITVSENVISETIAVLEQSAKVMFATNRR